MIIIPEIEHVYFIDRSISDCRFKIIAIKCEEFFVTPVYILVKSSEDDKYCAYEISSKLSDFINVKDVEFIIDKLPELNIEQAKSLFPEFDLNERNYGFIEE